MPGDYDGIQEADHAVRAGVAAAVTAVTIATMVTLMVVAGGRVRVVNAGLHCICRRVHLGAMRRDVGGGRCRKGPGATHGCDHQCEDHERQQ